MRPSAGTTGATSGTTTLTIGGSNTGANNLTADHIIQNALIIGGASGNLARVTIDASNAMGNPLDQASGVALFNWTTAPPPVDSGSFIGGGLGIGGEIAAAAGDQGGGRTAVPEPNALPLLIFGVAVLIISTARTMPQACLRHNE